jgi:predicted metal-binding protein
MDVMPDKSSIVTARLRRPPPILVCKKCLGRVADGKAITKTLKSELKRCAAQGGKRPRVVSTSCLGICPKRAVVVASAATLHKGHYLLLADGKAAAEAIALLIPDQADGQLRPPAPGKASAGEV